MADQDVKRAEKSEMSRKKGVWLDAVYNAADHRELAHGYDGWAKTYDQDLMQYGYRLPTLAAGMIGRHLAPDTAPILDVGCGTGLLGEAMVPLGYTELDGLDLSSEMLAVAQTKNIYKNLLQARLGDPLDLPDNRYAAITSIGTFTVGHAGPEGFDEIIRITKPGGFFVISIRTDIDPDNPHRQRLEELERAGAWSTVEISGEIVTMPWENDAVRNRVFVMRKPG